MYGTDEEQHGDQIAEAEARGDKAMTGIAQYQLTAQDEVRLKQAATRFDTAIGANPPVPLASCTGKRSRRARNLISSSRSRSTRLTKERSLLAGPVTIVGKVVRQVRRPGDVYVDRKAVAAYTNAVFAMDERARRLPGRGSSLGGELTDDVTVSPPGAVILPIAIYK